MIHTASRQLPSQRVHLGYVTRQQPLRFRYRPCRAAAADDPYEVLGIPQQTRGQAVEDAYRKRKRAAEAKDDKEELKRIEAAHSALFMQSLSSRLSGSGPVDKGVKHADKLDMIPWRPKVFQAPPRIRNTILAVFAVMILYQAMMYTTQMPVNAAIASVCLQCWKQYELFPAGGDQQKRLDTGLKNIFRAACLALMAALLAVLIFWTIPAFIGDNLPVLLPVWFYERQTTIIALGSLITQMCFTLFLR